MKEPKCNFIFLIKVIFIKVKVQAIVIIFNRNKINPQRE